jgi:hypothetical protein
MIDLIIPKNKNIFRFTTEVQSAVEHFCINVLNMTYDDVIFSDPIYTGNQKKFSKFSVCIVKATVFKKRYKFVID